MARGCERRADARVPPADGPVRALRRRVARHDAIAPALGTRTHASYLDAHARRNDGCDAPDHDEEAIARPGEALDSEPSRGTEAIPVSDDPYDTVDGEPYSPEKHGAAQIVGIRVHIDEDGMARVHGFTTRPAYDEFMRAWRSELPERDSSRAPRHDRPQALPPHQFSLCLDSLPSTDNACTIWYGGDSRADLGAIPGDWNDAISSGEVAARTHVTLYEHPWYGGNWYDFDNTSWNDYWYNVDGWFNDQASSFVSGNY